MRRQVLPAVAALLLATTSIAGAQGLGRPAVSYAVGSIKAIDSTKGSLTLDDGNTYMLPQSIKATDFKIGEAVNVSYTNVNGKHTVSAVNVAN